MIFNVHDRRWSRWHFSSRRKTSTSSDSPFFRATARFPLLPRFSDRFHLNGRSCIFAFRHEASHYPMMVYCSTWGTEAHKSTHRDRPRCTHSERRRRTETQKHTQTHTQRIWCRHSKDLVQTHRTHIGLAVVMSCQVCCANSAARGKDPLGQAELNKKMCGSCRLRRGRIKQYADVLGIATATIVARLREEDSVQVERELRDRCNA